jgi:hypothetical protein
VVVRLEGSWQSIGHVDGVTVCGYCTAVGAARTIPTLRHPATTSVRGFVTGIVTLNPAPPAAARRLDVSFTTVFGQYAPQDGITIHAVPVPH